MNKLSTIWRNCFKRIEKYLNELTNKYKHIKTTFNGWKLQVHNYSLDNGVYRRLMYEFGTICLNGFFIWVMLFPIVDSNPIWFIPSYGIIPWFIINFKNEWNNK